VPVRMSIVLCALWSTACSGTGAPSNGSTGSSTPSSAGSTPPSETTTPTAPTTTTSGAPSASITQVSVTGDEGAYTLFATVLSDETGCDQYADWWEVLTPEGALIFRRILNHSHPDEQPFTRDGGPVPIAGDQEVVVRAHLHPLGFGSTAVAGSVSGGFSPAELEGGFAAHLEMEPPLPEDCWW
jgi:hypothetical protein